MNTLWVNRLWGRLSRLLDRIVQWLPMVMLSWMVFWCGWQGVAWLAPAMRQYRVLSSPIPLALGARIVDTHWFGTPPVESAVEALVVNVLGVYAPTRDASGGFAIVQEGTRSVPLQPGQAIMGRWKLARVTASGIVARAGAREEFVPLVSRDSRSMAVSSQNSVRSPQLLSIPDELSSEMAVQK